MLTVLGALHTTFEDDAHLDFHSQLLVLSVKYLTLITLYGVMN